MNTKTIFIDIFLRAAGELVDALKKTDPSITAADKLCVQIAGLCHDLGKGSAQSFEARGYRS